MKTKLTSKQKPTVEYKILSLNLECSDGTYGKECQNICGYCADLDVCHHTNGSCPNGCEAGYKGRLCKARKLTCCNASTSTKIKNRPDCRVHTLKKKPLLVHDQSAMIYLNFATVYTQFCHNYML